MVKRTRQEEEISNSSVSEDVSMTDATGSDEDATSMDHENRKNGNLDEEQLGSQDENEDEDEDEDENEDENDEDSEEEITQDKKRAKTTKPQLTAQDVQMARETAELFKSNIFKLEIDELVKELRLKDSHCKLIEKVLHRLHDIIQQVPKSKELSLSEAENYFSNSKNKVSIPFPDPKPTNLNYKLQYDTPEDVSLVGSFGLKTGFQQHNGMSIDVALTIPKSHFQPKDYLNYRALYKRAFYVGYLADNLINLTKKNHLPVEISYEYVNGDKLCPALHIESYAPDKPHSNDLIFEKTKFSIRLIVGFEFGLFDTKKLLPDRNCIRVQLKNDTDALPPTPLYNASLLSSTAYNFYLKYLYTNKKSADAFRDAAVLGKLWLKQKGFTSHFNQGGFGHFEFSILMSALLGGGGENGNKILLHGFSSYQLFKGTIKYLATQDLCNEGYLSFNSVVGETNSIYKKNGFHVPTIFDKNTKINLLWKMSNSSYSVLKKMAQDTLELLNDVIQDRFRPIFILNSNNNWMKYDTIIQIPINALEQEDLFGPLEKISFLTYENFVCSKVYRILTKALDDRVHEISVSISSSDSRWSVHKRKPSSSSESDDRFVTVGLYLNSLECEKKVTKGPLHSDKINGEKFASFWGSKAQVRKYKDGNIQYSCLWNSSPLESTVITVTKYILNLHLAKDISDKLIINSTKFTKLLPQPLVSQNSTQPIILPSNFQSLKNSYNDTCKILQNLNLPLAIRSILPISPELRCTSLLLPVPFAASNPDFFSESILQFETSMKWPDELIALEKTKTAFLLKVDELINKETAYKSYLTKDETTIPYNKEIKILHVLSPDGYGFKFRVLTERDEVLYLRAIENANEKQKKPVTDVYLKFNQKYMGSVKHHRAISTLVNHFPFYSPTVRLFKSWLESQLLLNHFSDELIELIAMKVFVDPAPFSIPSSVESGFLKILQFLSYWNWKEDPLILDLAKDFENSEEKNSYMDKISDKLTVQSYQAMYNNFIKLRKDDPHALMVQYFVASKEDPSGKLWTSSNMTLPIASRLTALAKASVSLLSKQRSEIDNRILRMIFTPALKDYDFVIKLKTHSSLSVKSGLLPPNEFKNLIQPLSSFPENMGSLQDPTQLYFTELKSRFNNVMILSCKKYTGLNENGNTNVITGLFNPSVTNGKKKYRVNIGYNVKPTEDEQVEFNTDAVLNEMVMLGGDLVASFERK